MRARPRPTRPSVTLVSGARTRPRAARRAPPERTARVTPQPVAKIQGRTRANTRVTAVVVLARSPGVMGSSVSSSSWLSSSRALLRSDAVVRDREPRDRDGGRHLRRRDPRGLRRAPAHGRPHGDRRHDPGSDGRRRRFIRRERDDRRRGDPWRRGVGPRRFAWRGRARRLRGRRRHHGSHGLGRRGLAGRGRFGHGLPGARPGSLRLRHRTRSTSTRGSRSRSPRSSSRPSTSTRIRSGRGPTAACRRGRRASRRARSPSPAAR